MTLYVSIAVVLGIQILSILLWRKKERFTPMLVLINISLYNWCHLELLRLDFKNESHQYTLLESLPMVVANMITIQNLGNLILKSLSILIWFILSIVISFDKEMVNLVPLLLIMLAYIFVNFFLGRKRLDSALLNEFKLAKSVDRLKSLLDIYINDGVIVVDLFIKEIMFCNHEFKRTFQKKATEDEEEILVDRDLKYILNRVEVEEQGENKDEDVYLWELLIALRQNSVEQTYETVCKYQVDSGEMRTFRVKITQINWDFTRSFVLVFTDITQQELVKSMKAQEESQETLLNIFSHELRTPIKNILGTLELLIKELVESATIQNIVLAKKYAEISQFSCKYLQTISNTFLDVVRTKHENLKINAVSFSLMQLLNEVRDMLEFQTQERELKICLDINSDVPENIVNDRDKLEQILINLLTNCIKNSGTNSIKIQVKLDLIYPDSIEFSVIDSATVSSKRFDKKKTIKLSSAFELSKAVNPEGKGLSIAISQSLTQALSETDDSRGIRIDSIVGKGSKFTFSISIFKNQDNYFTDFQHPMLADEREDIEMSLNIPNSPSRGKQTQRSSRGFFKNLGVSNQNIEFLGDIPYPALERTASALPSFNPSSLHEINSDRADEMSTILTSVRAPILVVDDNPVDLLLVSKHLDDMKIPFKTAIGGEACLELVDQAVANHQTYKAILLDCYMPDMNGYQTAKILKARMSRREIPDIPIIAISAHDSQENREKAFKAGMVAWYTKPLREENLKEILYSCVRMWRINLRKDREKLLE